MEFVEENLPLILGIAVTLLTLVGSIIGAIAKFQKTSFVLMVAVAISAIVTAQQIISYDEEKQKELLEESRGILITQIKENVVQTRITVEGIAAKLEAEPLTNIATPLVMVDDDPEREDATRVLAFGKGSARMWGMYADWIHETKSVPNSQACLSVTINADHRYVTWMLLAYLYTDDTSRNAIKEVMRGNFDGKFPDADFINNFGITTQGVRCLLIYEGNKNNLVGFADATQFANELMTYQQRGMESLVEKLLNTNGTTISAIQRRFPSVSTNILKTAETKILVKQMIDEQIPEAAVLEGQRPFLLQLEKIIKLAAASE